MPANVGDVYSVKCVCRSTTPTNAVNSLNIRHYRVTVVTGISVTDPQVAVAADNLWAPVYKAYLPVLASYRGVIVQKVFPLPLAASVHQTAGAGIGTRMIAGQILPTQITGLIAKRTPAAGRAFRGRVYAPFPMEDDNDISAPNGAYLVALGGIAVVETTPINAGAGPDTAQLNQVIFRRTLPALSVQVSSADVRPYWGTQRRRNPGFRPDGIIL